MNSFADSFKREIARVARKELRDELASLRKTTSTHRAEIAGLKRQVNALRSELRRASKARGAASVTSQSTKSPSVVATSKVKPGRKVLFTAERLKTQRARLGFTQDQMAKLLDVSSLSIWKWESGGAVPRASRVPQILQRLALGNERPRPSLRRTAISSRPGPGFHPQCIAHPSSARALQDQART